MANIYEVFENEDSVMLITTWCPRGDLETLLLGDGRCVTEQEIQRKLLFFVFVGLHFKRF